MTAERPDALTEAVTAAREQEAKATALHNARSHAHAKMRQAIAEHEFLVAATRQADAESSRLNHVVETLIRKRAYESVAGAA